MLLIITNKDDLSADFLITRLIELNKPYFRLNSEDISEMQGSLLLTNDKINRKFSLYGKEIELDLVRSIWYRRKIYAKPALNAMPEQKAFISGELTHFIEGMVSDPTILWVNPMESVLLGERKLFQLRLASKLGFKVPQTLVSNTPHELRDFFHMQNGHVICKPIYHGLFITETERFAIYTHRVNIEDLTDDDSIHVCPVLLQQEITKGSDIRLTYIGDEVYPVEIYSDNKMPLDWRRQREPISYRICKLDDEIDRLCRLLMKVLNLQYGAFDFVRSASGEWFFMEINPTGEWAWLEKELGLPMRDSFIKLFYRSSEMPK